MRYLDGFDGLWCVTMEMEMLKDKCVSGDDCLQIKSKLPLMKAGRRVRLVTQIGNLPACLPRRFIWSSSCEW